VDLYVITLLQHHLFSGYSTSAESPNTFWDHIFNECGVPQHHNLLGALMLGPPKTCFGTPCWFVPTLVLRLRIQLVNFK